MLEARRRVGGACTIEEVWPGYRISPCAYLVGLLHPLVIEELDLPGYGFEWIPATAGLFVPFEDGSSVQLWDDDERCEAEIRRLSAGDVDGWRPSATSRRGSATPCGPPAAGDLWVGRAPTTRGDRRAARRRPRGPAAAVRVVDGRVRRALLPGRAAPDGLSRPGGDRHQRQPARPGDGVDPLPPPVGPAGRDARGCGATSRGGWAWSRSSSATSRARPGAVVATGAARGPDRPGRGGRARGGRADRRAGASSRTPTRGSTLRLLGDAADPAWKARVEAIPQVGCTVKLNVALSGAARASRPGPGRGCTHHLGQINTPLTKDRVAASFKPARAGELPERLWTELYFQTAHDPSVAPTGVHTMSVFAQYVPHTFAQRRLGHAPRRGEASWRSARSRGSATTSPTP